MSFDPAVDPVTFLTHDVSRFFFFFIFQRSSHPQWNREGQTHAFAAVTWEWQWLLVSRMIFEIILWHVFFFNQVILDKNTSVKQFLYNFCFFYLTVNFQNYNLLYVDKKNDFPWFFFTFKGDYTSFVEMLYTF